MAPFSPISPLPFPAFHGWLASLQMVQSGRGHREAGLLCLGRGGAELGFCKYCVLGGTPFFPEQQRTDKSLSQRPSSSVFLQLSWGWGRRDRMGTGLPWPPSLSTKMTQMPLSPEVPPPSLAVSPFPTSWQSGGWLCCPGLAFPHDLLVLAPCQSWAWTLAAWVWQSGLSHLGLDAAC